MIIFYFIGLGVALLLAFLIERNDYKEQSRYTLTLGRLITWLAFSLASWLTALVLLLVISDNIAIIRKS